MRLKPWLVLPALAALLLPFGHTWADDGAPAPSSVETNNIDLTRILAPPPAPGSPEDKADLETVLKLQAERTDAQAAACAADEEYSVFRFADVVGPAFDAAVLPATSAYFSRAIDVAKNAVESSKDHWNRPRPYQLDTRVKPCVKLSKHSSYPSGHATAGTTMTILLADMLPEMHDAIYARGQLYIWHRVMGGAHNPTDVLAGRLAGTAIAQQLLYDPQMQVLAKAARKELRTALKLPL